MEWHKKNEGPGEPLAKSMYLIFVWDSVICNKRLGPFILRLLKHVVLPSPQTPSSWCKGEILFSRGECGWKKLCEQIE